MSAEHKFLMSGHNLTRIPGYWNGIRHNTQTTVSLASNAGYDGVELAINRTIGKEIMDETLTYDQLECIQAVLGSFRGEPTIFHTIRSIAKEPHRSKLLLGSFAAYPNIERSYNIINHLQISLPDLPAVLQPPIETVLDDTRVKNKSVVFSHELIMEIGASDPEGVVNHAKKHGYRLVLDPFQSRRPHKDNIQTFYLDWQNSLPILAQAAIGLHISLGRDDLYPGSTNIAEFNDIYLGRTEQQAETQIVENLKHIAQIASEKPNIIFVSIQLPYPGVIAATSNPWPTLKQAEEVNRQVLTNVRNIMS